MRYFFKTEATVFLRFSQEANQALEDQRENLVRLT